ncbi:MAG: phosphoribosylformylglycinamidine synthase subunit PurS [Bradymonadaceae bacterium]
MTRVRVIIRNKPSVFDPEGEAIDAGIERLGHEDVESVRVGKIVDIEFDSDDRAEIRERLDEICEQFLVNPVIERYEIEFIDGESNGE